MYLMYWAYNIVCPICIYIAASIHVLDIQYERKEDQAMTADIAKAMHKARIERYEKIRCPKNYCRIERN